MARYYVDTSIWLDLFEARNSVDFPKGELAKNFFESCVYRGDWILCSPLIFKELETVGYSEYTLTSYVKVAGVKLILITPTSKELSVGVHISRARNIPRLDVLHALLAKRTYAVLVSWDKHFSVLRDIVETKTPREII